LVSYVFYAYESADGKRDHLYDLYLVFSSSSITISISSIFWGTLISFKINKEENTTTFPDTEEKIKLLAVL